VLELCHVCENANLFKLVILISLGSLGSWDAPGWSFIIVREESSHHAISGLIEENGAKKEIVILSNDES
jgi:hypothetical protein